MAADPPPSPGELSEDRLLGGRVVLRQPRHGALRASLDAVLLAAAVPARPGETVLEAGCGSGAAFLCLAARVAGVTIAAVERDPALATLAAANARLNGLDPDTDARVTIGTVRDLDLAQRLGPCAHGMANPPWWPDGTAPPTALRRGATHEADAALADWAAFLAAAVLPGGTVTLVLPAARCDAGLAALARAGCGGTRLVPLWPRAGRAAKRVLLQARRGRRGPMRVEPGLVLHGPAPAPGYTAAAEAILRDAAPLPAGG